MPGLRSKTGWCGLLRSRIISHASKTGCQCAAIEVCLCKAAVCRQMTHADVSQEKSAEERGHDW